MLQLIDTPSRENRSLTQTYGPNHLAVATALHNVATTLCNQQRYAAARPLLIQALSINAQIYG